MTSRKILGAAAALALVLPLLAPSTNFAQQRKTISPGGRVAVGGAPRMAQPRMAQPMAQGGFQGGYRGGAFQGGAPATIGRGQRTAAIAANPAIGMRPGSPGWQAGARYRRGGAFWPGVAAGAAIGSLGSYAYYGSPYYGGDSYYSGDDYAEEPSVAVMPDTGGDAASYCAQRFRSYDPASGTYLGYDGQRHPCP